LQQAAVPLVVHRTWESALCAHSDPARRRSPHTPSLRTNSTSHIGLQATGTLVTPHKVLSCLIVPPPPTHTQPCPDQQQQGSPNLPTTCLYTQDRNTGHSHWRPFGSAQLLRQTILFPLLPNTTPPLHTSATGTHLRGSPSCSSSATFPGRMARPHSSARSKGGTSSSAAAAAAAVPLLLLPPSRLASASRGPNCHADAGSTGMEAEEAAGAVMLEDVTTVGLPPAWGRGLERRGRR